MTPASIRNRNPGAMEPGPSSRKFGSASHEVLRWSYQGKPRTNKIATFPTDQHGAAAMFDLLERKYTGKPLQQAVSTWCGDYWSGAYAKNVEAACGIAGGDVLTRDLVRDPLRAIPLAQAMAKVEAGRDYPLDAEGWREAHVMAFADALAPTPSPANDVPYQKAEGRSREAVQAVAPAAVAVTTAASAAIPGVPDAVTTGIATAQSWQAVGDQAAAMVKWGMSSPLALAIVAAAAGLMFLPKLMRH